MQRMNENRSLENKPLGDLFGDLATDMANLVRQEVALAKLEVTQKAKHVGRNVGYLVVGGAIAHAAMLAIITAVIMLLARVMPNWGATLLLAIITAVIMLLARVMPNWGATLLVGVVVAGISWLLIGKALSALQQTDMTPRETVETLKEDAAWAKQQIK